MFKVGLSTCGKIIDEQLFAAYAKQGIDAMEISPNWSDFKHLNYKQLESYAKQYGITLWSIHLPFQVPDPSTTHAPWRLCGVEYLSEVIRQACDIGIQKLVAHPGMEMSPTDNKAERMECAKDSFNKLADIAAEFGGEICIEDLPRRNLCNCIDEVLELISVNDKLRVCFDTNHLLTEDVVDFVKRVGNKITTLHVSDYDFVDERHWLPGKGIIQWDKLIAALVDAGYNGVWMYEIGRSLETTNYVENAHGLFESFRNARSRGEV